MIFTIRPLSNGKNHRDLQHQKHGGHWAFVLLNDLTLQQADGGQTAAPGFKKWAESSLNSTSQVMVTLVTLRRFARPDLCGSN